ncbi:beta strand repeat-containing protein, partial [Bartonella sp. AA9NXGY]|uniref:beta strand repeat-containing protein n=1 Tax=Bartonella sp. AA9NXGY TaxID=3243443 RepID=UPI0035D0D178
MYKTSLLSCTAAAAIILFNIQFTAHAETLDVANEEKDISGKTYETIYVKNKGKITGSTVTVTGNKNTNTDTGSDKYVVTVEGANSALELNSLNIQGTDSDVRFGISVKDGANINLTGGNITASQTGVYIDGSKDNRNILQNVVISDNKNEASSLLGIKINKKSFITLENVTVKQAQTAIDAYDSTVKVLGGSFDAEKTAIFAQNGSNITLTGDANITSNDVGLYAAGSKAIIEMTGGSITAKEQAVKTTYGGHIIATDVTLKTKDVYGIGVACEDLSIIELLGKTTINNAFIGIQVIDEATIKMIGGTITASAAGATFLNSHSYKYENKLENVTISSIKEDVPLFFGIKADASYISLNNVTVTQAQTAIEAYDSIINVLGGSFDAERTAIFAQNGSTIALTGDANITSNNAAGLHAADSKSIIEMTGGSITAKEQAVKTTSGGHITVTDVTLKTKDGYGTGAVSSGLGSMIELLGKTTINDAFFGLQAQNGGAIKMTGGTITTTSTSAIFSNSNSSENKLENVTISGVKKDGTLYYGINANKSTVTLKDVTVAQAATGVFEKGVLAENDSTITISGGSFHAQNTTISAKSGSAITLTNNANITSDNVGLYAEGSNSTISMTEGTVTGKGNALGNALVAENGGHITVADVTLKTNDSDKSSGVFSNGANSVIFLEKTTISSSGTGLAAIDGGAVNMTGGSVAANETALFAINGGHIDLKNVSATAEVSGLQFVTHPTTKQDELNDPQKHHSNEINLTNAELHAENGTGIFIRAFTNANIKNSADLSIGTVNLTNSEIHADVLLGDGLFTKKESFWEEKNINEISNGTFTLSADQSTLEGRANIAKDRNVHFDLKNKTTWTLKT